MAGLVAGVVVEGEVLGVVVVEGEVLGVVVAMEGDVLGSGAGAFPPGCGIPGDV